MSPPPIPPSERVFLASPVRVGEQLIASPFQFLMTGEDQLVVTGWSDTGAIALAVHGRFLKDTGEIQPFVTTCPTAATVAGLPTPINLGKGYLLNIALTVVGATSVPWGRAYARVNVVRGTVGPSTVLGSLLGGYVTSGPLLAWPGSPIINPWEGAGYLEWRNLPAPGAGVSPSISAGAITRWQIVAARCTITPSSTVATRKASVAIRETGFDFLRVFCPQWFSASETTIAQWAAGLGGQEARVASIPLGALPDPFWILPNQTLFFTHTNFDASDSYADIYALLRQYLSIP